MKTPYHQIGTRLYDGLELRALMRKAKGQGRSPDAIAKELIEQAMRLEETFGGAGQAIYLPEQIRKIVVRLATENKLSEERVLVELVESMLNCLTGESAVRLFKGELSYSDLKSDIAAFDSKAIVPLLDGSESGDGSEELNKRVPATAEGAENNKQPFAKNGVVSFCVSIGVCFRGFRNLLNNLMD